MITSPIRYGVLGTGMMGLEHLRNLALFGDAVRVTALADPHPPSLDAAQRQLDDLGLPSNVTLHRDAERLADDSQVDAVIVASPNYTHASCLEPFWATGKHLLVEKPLATTQADCRTIVERAAKHGGVVWTAMEYRYMPPVARLIEQVHAGDIGEPVMIAIREHRFPFLEKIGDWNRFSRNTGGTLVEKCCHFFDLMNYIAAPRRPLRVFSSGAQSVNHLDERYVTERCPEGEVPDILDNAFVIVEYEGGLRAQLDLCMFAEASRNEQEISVVGSEGKIESFVPQSLLRFGRRRDFRFGGDPTSWTHEEIVPVDESLLAAGHHHGSTYFEHQRFLAAVRGEGQVEVSAEDGARAVAIGVAAHRSIEEGRMVTLE